MLALSRRLFNDFPSFDRQVDRFFNDAWNRDIRLLPSFRAFRPELDAFERDGQRIYRLALPGRGTGGRRSFGGRRQADGAGGAQGTGRCQPGRLGT